MSRARPAVAALAAACALVLGAGCHGSRPLVVGSKKFTESVLLGELATRLLVDGGVPARHEAQLGGTRVLWDALGAGRIDVYAEYTGTLCQEILRTPCDRQSIERALAARHVAMTPSLGFSDGYALAARSEVAARLHLGRISDLATHPELRLGFSEEFLARGDGWPALRARYRLPQTDVRGLDHDLAWRGLDAGTLDVIDAYGTDAEIRYYRPTLLVDDL
ncbi:MAG TPA: glycine betaine ABC transporter substrate-binding protein, partial [Polyangia bacterium]